MTKTDKIEMAIAKIHERLAHLEKMALLQAELQLLQDAKTYREPVSGRKAFILDWLRRKPK
jgi:hypothetical protein